MRRTTHQQERERIPKPCFPGCGTVILFFQIVCAAAAAPLRLPATAPARFVPGRILVQPKSGVAETGLDAKLLRHGARQRHVFGYSNVRVVDVAETNAAGLLAELQQDPTIEFAERDYIAEAAAASNDPYVQSGGEWHLAKIQSFEAWNVTSGASNIVVAVLDSGVNAAHPDLAGQLVPGFDFVNGDADPTDDFGHGTAVAGVVGAAANNATGVAGVAFGGRVLPVKVMDANGFAYYSTIAQGIYYAVAHGARVINISIAGVSPSATLQNAVNYAWSNNVVVVAAAGNNGNDVPYYPAACSNAVAVSATTANDALASFSSYGGHLALAAPGETIWTTVRDVTTGYAPWNGTSFASPVVAGVAALVLAAKPTLTGGQVVSLLKETADDLGAPGFDPWFGFGRVNALRAVTAAVNFDPAPSVNVLSPTPGTGVSGQVTVAVAATASSPVARIECYVNGQSLGTNAGSSATFQWTTAGLADGTYTLQARAVDTLGNVGYSQGVTVTVVNTPPPPATITDLARAADGSWRLTWTAVPNRKYRVLFTTNLGRPDWQNLSPDVTATNESATVVVQPGAPQGYFRVQSLP